ncbi:MAG: IS110 family transposase [Methanobacteriota archaeon]|nr:MAG: IS110 family transposase [Euryarchaeota archaeon]
MNYIGLDVHKRFIQVQQMDDDGALISSMNIATCQSNLSAFLDELESSSAICFEASGSYWWISQLLQAHPNVAELKVVDPRRSRKLAEELSVLCGYGRAKNDRIDAEMLAELHRRGMAPAIHLPTPEQLEMRTLNRHRIYLVQQSTRASAVIQALLCMHGVRISTEALRKEFKQQQPHLQTLPGYVRLCITQLLEQIRLYHQQIGDCEVELDRLLPPSHPQIKLLISAPGVGIMVARTIISEIFSIEHFADPDCLISYGGLAPVTAVSAGKKGVVKLNRHCNYYLKYAFMVAAHGARSYPQYRKKYQQDVKKHGKTRAKFNLARRIIKAIYWMLTRQQPFRA